MRDIHFRVWHRGEKKMYYRGYQKLTHVLLCEDDRGENEGKGTPAKRAGYDDCIFMEGSGILDKHGREIFEGDRIRIVATSRQSEGVLESIPDMFKSRGLHPFHSLLQSLGIPDADAGNLEFEIRGNIYDEQKK